VALRTTFSGIPEALPVQRSRNVLAVLDGYILHKRRPEPVFINISARFLKEK
jgi:hypothetical protein